MIQLADSRPLFRLLQLIHKFSNRSTTLPVILTWFVNSSAIRILTEIYHANVPSLSLELILWPELIEGQGSLTLRADQLTPFIPIVGPCAFRVLPDNVLGIYAPDLQVEIRGALDRDLSVSQPDSQPFTFELGEPMLTLPAGVLANAVRRSATAITRDATREHLSTAYIGPSPETGHAIMFGTDQRHAILVPLGSVMATHSFLLEPRVIRPFLAPLASTTQVSFYRLADQAYASSLAVKTETLTVVGSATTWGLEHYPIEILMQMFKEGRAYPYRTMVDRKRWKRLLRQLPHCFVHGEPGVDVIIDETGQTGLWCASGHNGDQADILVGQPDFYPSAGSQTQFLALPILESLLHSGGDTVTIAFPDDQPHKHYYLTDGWFEAVAMPMRKQKARQKGVPPPESSVSSSPE